MADFKTIRGTSIILTTATALTITNGVEYTLEDGQDATTCFIRITNNRLTGMGKTASGGTQNEDNFTVYVSNPNNIATSIDLQRLGNTNDCRVDWEIVQYIGPTGGDNEIIVRSVDVASISGTTDTITGTTITSIGDINKAALFITGQRSAVTTNADWWSCLFVSSFIANASDWDPTFVRGISSSVVGGVSYAAVEFTGRNWRDIQRDSFTTEVTAWDVTNNTNSGTVAIGSSLLDSSKAFLHVQYSTSNDATGLDDAGDNVELTASTTLYTVRNSSTSGTRTKVVWVIENTQDDDGAMSVEHVAFYDGTTGGVEERQWTQTVTAVAALDEASIFGYCGSSDGAGTAYPRGSINVRLTAIDTVTLTESDNGQERRISFDIVQWPSAPVSPRHAFINFQNPGIF